MFVEYNRFEEIFSPFPIIQLKTQSPTKFESVYGSIFDYFVGNMKVHTRKLDVICSDLTIRIPNIQMFFVIQHELIVQGKRVVRSDHRVLGTLNR